MTYVAAAHVFKGARVTSIHQDVTWALGFGANVHFSRQGTDYFQAGVELVWVVYPMQSKIYIYSSPTQIVGVTHADILGILTRYGSLESANACAAQYAESARKAICTFPNSEIKRALLWAPEFVVAREK